MKRTADVVVIGAGIQGLSAAYHLARGGIRDVIVVEKEFIGAGSSGRSASMLSLHRDDEPKIRLSQFSFDRYMAFKEELGTDIAYKPIGYLSVAVESNAGELQHRMQLCQSLDIPAEILSPDEIKALAPLLNTDDLVLGLFDRQAGVIDAHAIMLGYADKARQLGVEIRQGIRAVGIRLESGHVLGVDTASGPIATRCVVNASGADAVEVGRWAGVALPIDNRARSVFVTDVFPLVPDDSPFVIDEDLAWYYRKEGPGVLMGFGQERTDKVSMSINRALLPQVVERAMHRVPVLAEARIAHGWSGLRPLTPDNCPIIGPVDAVEGYIVSCGWGGTGVMHAPAGGQLVAEAICNGRATILDLNPFLLSRFDRWQQDI